MKLFAKLKNTIGTRIFKKKKPGSTGGNTDDTVRVREPEYIAEPEPGRCQKCNEPLNGAEGPLCGKCEKEEKEASEKLQAQDQTTVPTPPLPEDEPKETEKKAEHKKPSLDEKIGGANSLRQEGNDAGRKDPEPVR